MTGHQSGSNDDSEQLMAALDEPPAAEAAPQLESLLGLAATCLDASCALLLQVDGTGPLWSRRARPDVEPLIEAAWARTPPTSPLMTDAATIVGDSSAAVRLIGCRVAGSDGEPLATLTVVDDGVGGWSERDTVVMRVLADAIGREILQLRAMALTRLANAKLKLLADASHQLAGSLDVEDSVGRLARLVVPLLGDWCVISVVDADGRLRDLGWWHDSADGRRLVAEFTAERLTDLDPRSPTIRALTERRSTVLDSGALEAGLATLASDRARDIWRRLSPGSYGVFPMTAGTATIGVLAIMRQADRPPMTPIAHEVAAGIADLAGAALENARLYAVQRVTAEELSAANARLLATTQHDRVVARALQDALLPRISSSSDLDIQARYRTADGEDQVGGDFYDAIDSQTAGTTLIIGDVSGHDIAAAAVMGRVTNMLRAFVWDRPDESPAELLERLDHAMTALGVDRLATVALLHLERPVGALQTEGRRAEWSNAGHLPPLLIDADSNVRLLGPEPDCPLGINYRGERRDYESWLPIGSTLLLYTDGLVENRDRDLDRGLAQLSDFVRSNSTLPLEALLDAVLAEMVGSTPTDDVAVVGVRVLA